MHKIALTGNMGSGKSVVAQVFQLLDVAVFNADKAGHELLNQKYILAQIIKCFGTEVLSNNNINRKLLANIVFKNKKALQKLNAIIHPEVMKSFETFCLGFKKKKYVICESAIIFEAGLNIHFDASILVIAPIDLKIKRVMLRDNCKINWVIDRLKNQTDDALKTSMADYVIINDEKSLLIPQIIDIHKFISKNAKK